MLQLTLTASDVGRVQTEICMMMPPDHSGIDYILRVRLPASGVLDLINTWLRLWNGHVRHTLSLQDLQDQG